MSNRKPNKSKVAPSDIQPPPGHKIVTGHRVSPHVETFAVATDDDDMDQARPAAGDEQAGVEKCAHCRQTFTSDEWAECEGLCPNDECRRNADLFVPELSEAEILRETKLRQGSDEISLRVDRLVNYDKDGRTDSRADKIFCTTIKPVGLDYLEVIRRNFGGGHFWLTMYQRGKGIVTAWDEGIEKPVAEVAPAPAPAPSVGPPADSLEIVIAQAAKVQELKRALVGDELGELRKLLAAKLDQPAASAESQRADNPFALFAPLAASDPSLAAKLMDRVFPEEEKSTWVADLLKHPQEALQLLGLGMQLLQQTFFKGGPSGPAGSHGQPVSTPTLNEQLPPPVLALIDQIAADVLNYEPLGSSDDESDGEQEYGESVWRSADAVVDEIERTPQVAVLLNLSPSELCRLLSGQAGLQVPGVEHLRLVGYEYIGKKKDADQFFRELKEAVATHPRLPAAGPVGPTVNAADTAPAPSGAAASGVVS